VTAFTDLDVILLTHPIRVNPTMRAVVFIPQALGDETRLLFPASMEGRRGQVIFFPAPMKALGYETRFLFSCVDEG
jgi:hypothetical protein